MGIEGLTQAQTQALTRINVWCSALSLAGSAFIVLTYLAFRDLRKFSFRLIFFLSFSDMMCSLFNLLGDPGEGLLCYLQGYATQFFWVASFLWTTAIAYTLHSTVVRHKASVVSLGPLFHVYVWGTALFMTLIPLFGNDYGPAGAWCWVQNETRIGKVLRFVTFYLPLWGAIIFNGTVYLQVIRMLSNASKVAANMGEDKQAPGLPSSSSLSLSSASSASGEGAGVFKMSSAMNRWGYYPLILIGSWTFGTVNKIHNLIEPRHPLFWLYCLHIGTAALMGLFNSIAYGLNATVRRTLREQISVAMGRLPEWAQVVMPVKPMFMPVSQTAEEDAEEGEAGDGQALQFRTDGAT